MFVVVPVVFLPALVLSFASAESTDQMIRDKCAREWPDDFEMRAYCEKKQVEGLRALER